MSLVMGLIGSHGNILETAVLTQVSQNSSPTRRRCR